jgi:N-methylhydantoinase B
LNSSLPAGRDEGEEPGGPVGIQLATGELGAICEEMGAVLVRSAYSANIKERRDCSTAIFDRDARLVMQAEHIPVHLGSMPASVASVARFDHRPGVSWFLNDPYRGGSHLPDITVVTPFFADRGELLGFTANRAHHADVGGVLPGSMPADSVRLDQEGVVIAPRVMDSDAIEEVIAGMRQPDQRRADLRAQIAANRVGVDRIEGLVASRGKVAVSAMMISVIEYAERRTRACIALIPDGEYRARDVLEGRFGRIDLTLEARVAGDSIVFDFGEGPEPDPGNLNCPRAVTESACFFAVRVLTDADIPASAGTFAPVEVKVREGSLLDARSPAAVVAGNVETSSRVADLCLAAFGMALGQGTMNNLTLGDEEFTYYETIGGGQGAFRDSDGPDATHVAMSNTLNTPIEALEIEFPLLAREYAVRRGSGGPGATRGGDGIIREIEACSPMSFSLLTERREQSPPGAAGGSPGKSGRNILIETDSPEARDLPAKVEGTLREGDRIRVETPGGGGFGRVT